MAELRMSPKALQELREAIDWYAQRSIETASAFAGSVDSAIKDIEENPSQFAALNSRYRYVRVQGFPYYVAFQNLGKYVAIAGVRHTSRSGAEFE